jgi:hypothetical protein
MSEEPDPDADCFKPSPRPVVLECIHCGQEGEEDVLDAPREPGDEPPLADEDIPF